MRVIVVDKYSPFLGEECPVCEHPFAPNDEIAAAIILIAIACFGLWAITDYTMLEAPGWQYKA